MFTEALARLALRISDREYDPRHAILDVAPELLALRDSASTLPRHLELEFCDLLAEIEKVQPGFPSRRTTSVLFDRAGMGRLGRERAIRLIQRLTAISAAAAKSVSPPD